MRQRTVFNTPVVTFVLRVIARLCLKLSGWYSTGEVDKDAKMVMIAAPHTSNWDFPIMIALAIDRGLKPNWMGKDNLFKGPMGPVMRWLGGIAIDRSKANNVVEAAVQAFQERDELLILIPPEGTRSKVENWKSGFYHIANGAGVPIQPGIMHAPDKHVHFAEPFMPTGDAEADIAAIRSLYAGKVGIVSEKTSD